MEALVGTMRTPDLMSSYLAGVSAGSLVVEADGRKGHVSLRREKETKEAAQSHRLENEAQNQGGGGC